MLFRSNLQDSAFNLPEGLSIEGSSLYVGDRDNNRIREINLSAYTPSSSSSGGTESDLKVSTLTGLQGLNGFKDGIGSVARLNRPYGMTVDTSGNLYIADRNNHRIRKVASDGKTTTFAGSGVAGNLDGIGLAAQFKHPSDIVIDSTGNLFVADYSNHLIRKITTTGAVTTFAGSGIAGNTDGTGVAAQFKNPIGLGIDTADNLYVADYNNSRIRKITPTGVVTTILGTAGAGYKDGDTSVARVNRPIDIAINTTGELYISDGNNHRIRKISGTTVTTVAGSGTASFADGTGSNAHLYSPAYIAFDSNNDLWISDTNNNRIRKLTISTGEVTTVAGAGLLGFKDADAPEAFFNRPRGIAIDSTGKAYVSENSSRIRLISQKPVLLPPAPIIINPVNQRPHIELISEINFDAANSFTIREGTSLNIKVFVFDLEEAFNVASNIVWTSSLSGTLAEGVKSFDTSSLATGSHDITIKVTDNDGLLDQIGFTLVVASQDEDLGDSEGGGADRNGDGVIDENDRNIDTLATKDKILEIISPVKKSGRRLKKTKLKAIVFDINEQARLSTDEIIWEFLTTEEAQTSDDTSEIREFVSQGQSLKLKNLVKAIGKKTGDYTVYARFADEAESQIRVQVKRRKGRLRIKLINE